MIAFLHQNRLETKGQNIDRQLTHRGRDGPCSSRRHEDTSGDIAADYELLAMCCWRCAADDVVRVCACCRICLSFGKTFLLLLNVCDL